jgi:hypothetical protein
VVADLTGGDPGEGIRTENGVMSLLVTEYVKEEIMRRAPQGGALLRCIFCHGRRISFH